MMATSCVQKKEEVILWYVSAVRTHNEQEGHAIQLPVMANNVSLMIINSPEDDKLI